MLYLYLDESGDLRLGFNFFVLMALFVFFLLIRVRQFILYEVKDPEASSDIQAEREGYSERYMYRAPDIVLRVRAPGQALHQYL